ncbi:MAG TPA: ABC transporter ATP-binding protein [Alphaproteobacteria bacterium]
MTAALLAVDDVSVNFGGVAALRNVSFAVPARRIVSVIGPNGAGKTTLFNVITGFRKPTTGAVRIDGAAALGLPPHQIARRGLVRTFQKTEVFPDLTVYECTRIGLLNHAQPGVLEVLFGSRKLTQFIDAAKTEVALILETVGLGRKAAHLARELSYGEQRLLEVAVALAARPRLILLDEPSSGLNAEESLRLADLIRRLRDQGMSVMLIEHNMNVVMSVSDTVVVLHHGEKIAEGRPADIGRDAAVVSAYLGRDWGQDAAG